MYIVKDDNPDVGFVLNLGTVTDSEGHEVPSDSLMVTVESDNPDAVDVTMGDDDRSGSISFGAPGLANLNVSVETASGKLVGSFGAQFTVTVGDPSAISGGSISFDGLTEAPEAPAGGDTSGSDTTGGSTDTGSDTAGGTTEVPPTTGGDTTDTTGSDTTGTDTGEPVPAPSEEPAPIEPGPAQPAEEPAPDTTSEPTTDEPAPVDTGSDVPASDQPATTDTDVNTGGDGSSTEDSGI